MPPVCLEIENLQAKEYSCAHVQLNEDLYSIFLRQLSYNALKSPPRVRTRSVLRALAVYLIKSAAESGGRYALGPSANTLDRYNSETVALLVYVYEAKVFIDSKFI